MERAADGSGEVWGGIAYGVCAAAVALPRSWTIRTLVKVGRDVEGPARAYLAGIPGVDASALVPVSEPNNRVTLLYRDAAERTEVLTGGVPGWSAAELADAADACDALLVNFVSGHEATLEACRVLRAHFDGPIHADLHSLFLGTAPDGTRVPRPLVDLGGWLACFDSVQLNEVEASLAGARRPETTDFAARALASGPEVCAVTLGASGVVWAARHGGGPRGWLGRAAEVGRIATGSVTIGAPRTGDPTGCGDVWGAAFFSRLLAGDDVAGAAERATRLAARNVTHRGADGLFDILNREVTP